jgi:galactose mutarotase-like enzyme
MPPHAIHGVTYDRPWSVVRADACSAELSIEMDARWPFRGRVTQAFSLTEDGLDQTLTLLADEPQPATIGWHPWFLRSLAEGSSPVELSFSPGSMLERGPDSMPTGRRVAPSAGPWDDAFTHLAADPVLEWPDLLRLTISSTCSWWVVYTQPVAALCVEPESGPPAALNGEPEVVVPGHPLSHVMRWRWERIG